VIKFFLTQEVGVVPRLTEEKMETIFVFRGGDFVVDEAMMISMISLPWDLATAPF
jgi:hypothetical protein